MKLGRCLAPMQCSELTFECQDGNMRYVIDLEEKSCDCGYWTMSGLPCSHALLSIVKKRMKPIYFVNLSMRKE